MARNRKKNQSKNSKIRHLITKMNPRSPIAEQFRTVRTNLQFSSADHELKSLMVTSSGPSEGKSSSAANLAVVYAQQGKKVLLVDSDMRKPTVHYTFRLDNLSGLSNILVGDASLQDTVTYSDVENLDVIACGPIPPNPSELLGSRRMEQFIKEAKMAYDIILFDTPPVLAVTDAQILANLCDGSMLIVRSKQTEYESAEKSIDVLQSSTAKFLGTVLNGVEKKKANYYYYYGT
ncbi:CpsD/CapB family tyrosine-protein kinase [Lentibacillus sp. CBA3610]|uniref:CpsD/CapB family tyrosine-protein kinase n=1 Tax=Lentibacillus sp. CBA3610 TaxID=2518176 RepID=UPI0026ECD338|nr:CpsD/CapB family tyrosine-protein kinase [Lentibacillus sp. CBA3610]